MNNFIFDPKTRFLNPDKILFSAGLSARQNVLDLGVGSGFFSIAAGKKIGDQGQVFAIDIMESSLDHVVAEARLTGLKNIRTIHADLEKPDALSKITTGSIDLVLVSNLIHQIKNSKLLFKDIYRVLKTGGKMLAIEWNDEPSPIGPQPQDRIKPESIIKLAKDIVLKEAGLVETDKYHYGLIFIK